MAEPEKLKYLLCPVIAQGRADQERFYELFDQYWAEVSAPWEMPLPQAKKEEKKGRSYPEWLPWLLASLMILGMGWAAKKMLENSKPTLPLKVFFKQMGDTPGMVRMGDTLHLENLSENYDSTARFTWRMMDEDSTLMWMDSLSEHLHYPIDSLVGSPRKMVALHLETTDTIEPPTEHVHHFEIHCAHPPRIDSIIGPRDIKVDEEAQFRAILSDTTGVEVNWYFGTNVSEDGRADTPQVSGFTGFEAKDYFPNKGQYEIRVRAVKSGQPGICETEVIHRVNVGRDDAYLNAKTLRLDEVDPIVNFSYSMWVLLGLLGVAMIWYWVKWAARKAPVEEEAEKEEDLTAAAQRFSAPDKGPYFIPFRSQEGHIRVEKDLYRLADVLRQRQEGLRNEMDVPASVKQTIAEGGFPRLLTQRDTVPTEYLFLLEDHSRNSHQGRLFEFMVNFLKGREVLGEVFYFDQRLHSFWNEDHPEGLSPEKLYRLHPNHRVVLMSDAHSLIEPEGGESRPKLRAELRKLFSHWKNRLLLTPMPLVSWTWREAALHELFPVFPIHTEGLAQAAKYMEQGMEDDEMRPTYASWCERLANLEGEEKDQAPDINYRRWRTAADHADYLKDHPKLYLWLKALAVYPNPDWNVTLAIGKALRPLGVKVDYDSLLILSRIPWLIKGDLAHRLRREFLADLDPEAERLAREAVRNEMQAVSALVKGGHANREHQVELALQNFSLASQKADNQELVRKMLALNLLSPKQVAQLNEQVSPGTKERTAAPLEAYLEKNKMEAEAPEKPFLTPDFYKASLATLLYLVLFALAWKYGGTPELSNFLKQDPAPTLECESEYLHAYFFKKECVADSAVLLNNQAVSYLIEKSEVAERSNQIIPTLEFMDKDMVGPMFERALVLRPDYQLAKTNRAKYKYNFGVTLYNNYVAEQARINNLTEARKYFRSAQADSLLLDALHGLGLAYFYEEEEQKLEMDSSQIFFGEIISLNPTYFDTLSIYPHLQSLIFGKLPAWQAVTFRFVDTETRRPLNGVSVAYGGKEPERMRSDSFYLGLSLGQRETFEFALEGYETATKTFTMGEESISETIRMRKNIDDERVKRLNREIYKWYSEWRDQMEKQAKLFPQQDGAIKEIIRELEVYIKVLETGISSGGIDKAEKEFDKIRSDYNAQLTRLKRASETLVDDADGDGVLDEDDHCPSEPGNERNYGCPGEPIEYGKAAFGFNGCDVVFDEVIKNVSLDEMVKIANKAKAEGFTYQSSLKYGRVMIGSYPINCHSDENLSWPLYLTPQALLKSSNTNSVNTGPDSDGDGLPDQSDKCPDFAGSATTSGCPESSIVGFVLEGENKEPMIGANIILKGTTTGTTSDFDGKFEIRVPNNDVQTLVVNYIGYQSIEKTARVGEQIEIIVGKSDTGLEQIVDISNIKRKVYIRIDPDLEKEGYDASMVEVGIEEGIAEHDQLEVLSFSDIASNLGKIRRTDLTVEQLRPYVGYIFYANLNSTRGGVRLRLSIYDISAVKSLGYIEISPPRKYDEESKNKLVDSVYKLLDENL